MPKLLIIALLLAACGADGPPVPPVSKADGITLSGEARVGAVLRK